SMKSLKKRIRQYVFRLTGTFVIIGLTMYVGIQIHRGQKQEFEKSVTVLEQMEQFIIDNVVSEEENGPEGLYSNLFSLIRVNSDADYYIISGKDERILGSTVPAALEIPCEEIGFSFSKVKNTTDGFHARINGEYYFCVFEKIGADYAGRCVPCSMVYKNLPLMAFLMFVLFATMAGILMYMVNRYMNRYVVDEIHHNNDELSKITEGDMEVKVDICSSEEFAELSAYINTMVGSLSDTTSKISYVLSKTNMFIGVYEYRKGYKPVHCTEYIPRIFSLELEEWRLLTSDYELFEEFITKVRSNPYEEEQGVFQFSNDPEQYVKLEEMEIGKEVFGVVIDVTEEVLRRRKIEEERDVDVLTGLFNRRGLETQLSMLFRERKKMGRSALVMIDADGLKDINDNYGHEFGDVYLKKIAGVINNFGIQSSISARIGGDEFVLFLYEYGDDDELLNTLKTIEYIQGHSTVRLNDELVVPLRFSFGYCLVSEGMTYEDTLKIADERMYADKRKRKAEAAKQKEQV
ncbi:MAG: diguanylate cyclase, partial [Lachnospiraceae bacterium]|nr:diguanylate cyclase [Lachnospiraceae bacterium]